MRAKELPSLVSHMKDNLPVPSQALNGETG